MNPTGKGGFKVGQSGNPGGRSSAHVEVRNLARQHTPAAMQELARLALKARSETARLKAIEMLLERGFGKPTQWQDSLPFELPHS
jgi:hypothetical protein